MCGRNVKILQRVHGEMYNRPISYQNALLSFGSDKTESLSASFGGEAGTFGGEAPPPPPPPPPTHTPHWIEPWLRSGASYYQSVSMNINQGEKSVMRFQDKP